MGNAKVQSWECRRPPPSSGVSPACFRSPPPRLKFKPFLQASILGSELLGPSTAPSPHARGFVSFLPFIRVLGTQGKEGAAQLAHDQERTGALEAPDAAELNV